MIISLTVCDFCKKEIQGKHVSIGSQEAQVEIEINSMAFRHAAKSFHFCNAQCLMYFLIKDHELAKKAKMN